MKKTISLMLTSVMLLSMTATAFAGEPLSMKAVPQRVLETQSIEELRQDPSVTFETVDNATVQRGLYDTAYFSTIDISCTSSLVGAERHYDQGYFTCGVSDVVLSVADSGTLRVEVGTKDWHDIEMLAYDTLEFTGDGQMGLATLGEVGSGDRVFKFVTGNAGIQADVFMRSYN